MTPVEKAARDLAELHREGAALVPKYLEHAQTVGLKTLAYARAVASETFNKDICPQEESLLTTISLGKTSPDKLPSLMVAVRAKAKVTRIIVCSNTFTVYFFGQET